MTTLYLDKEAIELLITGLDCLSESLQKKTNLLKDARYKVPTNERTEENDAWVTLLATIRNYQSKLDLTKRQAKILREKLA